MDVSDPATAVFPAGTAGVLSALTGAESAFTVRHVARLAGVSHNRARQVIARLAEHGLVEIEEQGPSNLCRFNRDHLAAGPVTALVQLRTRMLDFIRREIAGWSSQPVQASLFGSAARADGNTSSDLDVLIIRPAEVLGDDPTWRNQLSATGESIHRATGNDVAWFDISRDDLRRAVQSQEPIVDKWRRDAVHLAGADLRRLLRSWT